MRRPRAGAPQAPAQEPAEAQEHRRRPGGAPQAPGAGAPEGPGRGAEAQRWRGGAAGGRGGAGAEAAAYTPPAGSKELKDVLYNWTWHMGMLRSGAESELIKTLDYYGAGGTIQVNGQPCTLTKYHLQANYQIPGYRTRDRVHARQQADLFGRREHERGLRLGRRHPGRGTRGRQGQVDATARHAHGAADSSLGQPARCAQGRHRRRRRACTRCSPSARTRPPCSIGRPPLA